MTTVPVGQPDEEPRQQIVDAMCDLSALGLNRGTSGNASLRSRQGFYISPSGIRTPDLEARDVVHCAADGVPIKDGGDTPRSRPSSEWRMHRAVLEARPEINAVVHCHSRFATVLACAHRPIPPIHYLIALADNVEVPLAGYAPFGSEDLARLAVTALGSGRACLLANHGLLVCAGSMTAAVTLAEDIEEQAAIAWHALAIGGAVPLDRDQLDEIRSLLSEYRQPR